MSECNFIHENLYMEHKTFQRERERENGHCKQMNKDCVIRQVRTRTQPR